MAKRQITKAHFTFERNRKSMVRAGLFGWATRDKVCQDTAECGLDKGGQSKD